MLDQGLGKSRLYNRQIIYAADPSAANLQPVTPSAPTETYGERVCSVGDNANRLNLPWFKLERRDR